MPYFKKKICSSAEGHLGYLHPLATVNSVSMNILSTNSENRFILENAVSWSWLPHQGLHLALLIPQVSIPYALCLGPYPLTSHLL